MDSPGANSDRNDATFEKYDTWLDLSIDPTLTADEMHPGDARALPSPSLPDAITLATPIDRRLSIAGLYGWSSHGAVKVAPPRLMLTATTLSGATAPYTYSRPAMMSDEKAPAQGATPPQLAGLVITEKTCTAMRCAPRATPEKATPAVAPLPAAIPATCVPWRQSLSEHGTAAPGPNC